jgi:hypothetical protein
MTAVRVAVNGNTTGPRQAFRGTLLEGNAMPYFDKETIENARDIDLLTYLESCEPQELVRSGGGSYRLRSHGSLKISNGKWYWWSRNVGGTSAIDYLVQVRGFTFTDAVSFIIDSNLASRAYCPPAASAHKVLKLPPRHETADNVRVYLGKRMIDEVISGGLIHAGRIYENQFTDKKSGRTFVNAVFVGCDSDGRPRYATIRGTNSGYKGEAAGSDKRYSFSIPAEHPSNHLHIFEGVMDLLSYATLMRMDGHAVRAEHLLSIGGIHSPREDSPPILPPAVGSYLERHSDIHNVHLHLDNDNAGRFGTDSLIGILSGSYNCYDEPPKAGKDYNDYLRYCRSPTEAVRGGDAKTANELSR